ncbi:MAG: signal peptidase I [Candidatus Omnitrophica bacterium]|nr:signal peptidase I [Candidatus Omnitrophota bacterium]
MWKEWGEPLLIATVIAIFIRTFLVGPYKIPTGSMRTTLLEGDRIFVDKITYRFRAPERGEIIVFKYPLDKKKDFVKRLIGFAGEEVEIRDGSIYINGKRLEKPAQITSHYYYNRSDWSYGREGQKFIVPSGYYFVLGDNSAQSSDSRNWGFVSKSYLVGKAFLIWWPLDRFGFVN